MGFKRILCMGGICLILAILSLLSAGGNAWGQAPLTINYSSLSVSCGSSQNLSASGGCPPYSWSLSGGGTLTPDGGGNTSATYVAPASNPNCANNAMITLTDCCRNTAEIQIAVNCYTQADIALAQGEQAMCSACIKYPTAPCSYEYWPGETRCVKSVFCIVKYGCDNTLLVSTHYGV